MEGGLRERGLIWNFGVQEGVLIEGRGLNEALKVLFNDSIINHLSGILEEIYIMFP